MTEKQLKKLKRYQLLELLIMQTEENEKMQAQVKELEEKLKEKAVSISSLGSIAEASLQLSGVFTAAQESADMYVKNAIIQADEIVSAAKQQAAEIIADAFNKSGESSVSDSIYIKLPEIPEDNEI